MRYDELEEVADDDDVSDLEVIAAELGPQRLSFLGFWNTLVLRPKEFFEHVAQGPSYSMLVFLARGIKTVYPEFRVEEMLTDKAIRLYEYVSHACVASSGQMPAASEMLKPDWENNRYVKEFFARNTLGRKPAFGPLLLISSETDTGVRSALIATAVAGLCEQKDRVLFVKYPALNESTVLGNSISEQVSWIRARFAGLRAPSNCP